MPDNLPSVAQINEDIARGLKKDGLSRAGVTQKMIEVHQMPGGEALALIDRIYGKEGDRAGRSQKALTGAAMTAAGSAAGVLIYFTGDGMGWRAVGWMSLVAFGLFSSGLIVLVKAVADD